MNRLLALILFLSLPTLTLSENFSRVIPADNSPLSALRSFYQPHFSPGSDTDCLSTWPAPCMVTLSNIWSNTALQREFYTLDSESLKTELSLRWHPGEKLSEVFLSLPFHVRGGGYLDNFIEGWHDFFSLPNGDRDRLPSRGFEISGTRRDGREFQLQSGSGIGNLRVGSVLPLAEWLSLRLEASLPTARTGFGHRGVDGLIALENSYQSEAYSLSAGVALSALSKREIENIRYRRFIPQAVLDGDYRLYRSVRAFASLLYLSDPIAGIEGYPSNLLYVDLGLRFLATSATTVTLGIRENPIGVKGTSDVDFFLTLSSGFSTGAG